MNCLCHGEAMYWQKDKRGKTGGHWTCGVTRRAKSTARYEAVREQELARQRARYDADPIYRHEKLMSNARRNRRLTIQKGRNEHRPKPALANYLRRVRDGQIQEQGLHGPDVEPDTETGDAGA